MPISVAVQNQNREPIRLAGHGLEELVRFTRQWPASFLLRGVHPYGDTIFNTIQLRFLLEEIGRLEQEFPDNSEMLEIIREAASEAIFMRGYLEFSGD
jgi:hypothetical protein